MPASSSRQTAQEPDDAVVFSAEFGLTLSATRATIRTLARAAGLGAGRLVEWSSADAPGAPPDLMPLYYAAWLPSGLADDLPLGLGLTPAEALADLLWALGTPELRHALRAHEDGPPADGTEATTADAEAPSASAARPRE
ncbi:MAG TPA: hypothetical protein VET66_10070 [Steroidobacteraceae bacterium]|nr:hypothetical protein [Steroidobacteraceae bacterium]